MPQLTLHRGRDVGCLAWGMERSLQANCFGGSSLLIPACCFSTTAPSRCLILHIFSPEWVEAKAFLGKLGKTCH